MKARAWWMAPAFFAAVVMTGGVAGAADKTKVDQATRQVEGGAKQIGNGKVGPGFKDLFVGIGLTIYEGAKYSGLTIKEFFEGSSR
jgi:hypothetical protein